MRGPPNVAPAQQAFLSLANIHSQPESPSHGARDEKMETGAEDKPPKCELYGKIEVVDNFPGCD